jgi:hypothetical protein
MNEIKLTLLSIWKYVFFCIAFPIQVVLGIVDILIHIFTLGKVDSTMSQWVADYAIARHKKILDREFKILFKK